MDNSSQSDEFRQLLARGRKQGYLTVDDIGALITFRHSRREQLFTVISYCEAAGLKVYPEPPDEYALLPDESEPAAAEDPEILLSQFSLGCSTEPLAMYARDVLKHPRLTPAEEAALLQSLKKGTAELTRVIAEYPPALQSFFELYELACRPRSGVRISDLILGFNDEPVKMPAAAPADVTAVPEGSDPSPDRDDSPDPAGEDAPAASPVPKEVRQRFGRLRWQFNRLTKARQEQITARSGGFRSPRKYSYRHELFQFIRQFSALRLNPRLLEELLRPVRILMEEVRALNDRIYDITVRKCGLPPETLDKTTVWSILYPLDWYDKTLESDGPFAQKLRDYAGEIGECWAAFRKIEADIGLDLYSLHMLLERMEQNFPKVRTAKKKLTEANLRLVIYFVLKENYGLPLPLSDLIQEGNIGLMKAIDRFDYRLGFKFSTYAEWWIRGSILNAVADQSRIIRVPRDAGNELGKAESASQSFFKKNGRCPSIPELAAATGFSLKKILSLKNIVPDPLSFEDPADDCTRLRIGDLVSDRAEWTSSYVISAFHELRRILRNIIEELPKSDAKILKMRFGIDLPDEIEQKEVARRLRISCERVRQIEHKDLRKLRHPCRSEILRTYVCSMPKFKKNNTKV